MTTSKADNILFEELNFKGNVFNIVISVPESGLPQFDKIFK